MRCGVEEGKEERIWREQSPDLCQSILAENKHKSLKSHFMRVGVGDWMTEEIVSVSEKKKLLVEEEQSLKSRSGCFSEVE